MIKTSTQVLDFTEEKNKKTAGNSDALVIPGLESPSQRTINNILNYSRNLEVKSSGLVETVEYIRS